MRLATIFTLMLVLAVATARAQEFPIANGNDNTFGGGGAYDGTNFLFGILGDAQNKYSITAQFVSPTGVLVGSRISLGQMGSTPLVAFDGTKYLMVWTDSFPSFAGGDTNGIGNIYGQFLSTSGALIGSRFTLVTDVNIKFAQGRGSISYQDTTYFLTYLKGGDHHHQYMYGQRISRTGSLIGAPIQISSHYARECAVAFDGTNYLVAWCRVEHPNVDKAIYGQFVSKTGTLVGTNFVIDESDNASDNPVTMTFDGTKFWVAYHEQAADTNERWNIYARFVSTSGVVASRFMVCDSTTYPTFASAAFDGTNYLITWMEFGATPRVQGRFFNASGVPLNAPFTVFGILGGKVPVGGVGGFVNGKFVLSATRVNSSFGEGDVYGLFLPSSTADVDEEGVNLHPGQYALMQNYPNPFNPSTTIRYIVGTEGYTSLRVYNLLGSEIATLVDEVKKPGMYNVEWNAADVPSGVYFYQLKSGTATLTRKAVLVR